MGKVTAPKDVINLHHHHQGIRTEKGIQTVVEVITDLVVVRIVKIAGIEAVGNQRRIRRGNQRQAVE
jgi:hypothetical protein